MNFCKLSSHFSRKPCDRGTWNLVCIEYPYGLIYKKKFQVPRSHSIGEKCDANFKLSSHFSRKLCDRGTWNLVCIEYPYRLIYKKNFKYLGCTVSEKNAMLSCKISKLFIMDNCATLNFCKISSHFSRKVCDRGTWNLVCKEYPYGLIYKKNFKFLGRTVSEKSAMLISSYHRNFLENRVRPMNMKFGLQRVSIWVNTEKKFSSSSVAQYRRKMRC